jgi:hypothetical protein
MMLNEDPDKDIQEMTDDEFDQMINEIFEELQFGKRVPEEE